MIQPYCLEFDRSVLFWICFTVLLIGSSTAVTSQGTVRVTSPDETVRASLSLNSSSRPVIRATLHEQSALQPGKLGITVDGTDLGNGVSVLDVSSYTVNQTYAWRGGTDQAHNHARGRTVRFQHDGSGQEWVLDVRAYNTGVAWRYVVPGTKTRRVHGEATTFNLPAGTTLWYQTKTTTYENNFQPVRLSDDNAGAVPDVIGPGATGILPDDRGYVTLAESDVLHYSGSTLKPAGPTAFQVQFHDNPDGWKMEGRIQSAWRVAIIASTLDELVNSNLVAHLAPAPDDEWFPEGVQTEWVQPGRSWWTWYVYGDAGASWDRQKQFVDEAAQLNCQYHLVDAGWEDGNGWLNGDRSKWDRLDELTDYAAEKDVGIWVWTAAYEGISGRASPGLETPSKRKTFFRRLAEAGAVGVKIDYFNDQSHRSMEIMRGCLQQAAEHELMINFHGVSPPAGQARTWPNEMTREGVRAMEHNKGSGSSLEHWTALPFTRFVLGHGDITPGIVPNEKLKNLTAVSQMAMATIYTSPLLCWAGTYEDFRSSGITDVLKTFPTTWDETRVLPSSEMGRQAVMARRKGQTWYLAALVGSGNRGKPAFKSRVVTGADQPKSIEVALDGARYLVLRTSTTQDGYDNDHTNWAEPTLITSDGDRVRLSSLTPVKSSQGWGSLKIDQSITGNPLKIGDQTFTHGLGTHAESTVVYRLKRSYKTLRAVIGIDEQAGSKGSARFSVYTRHHRSGHLAPDLSFLGDHTYQARMILDGKKTGTFRSRTRSNIHSGSTLSLPIKSGGGFLVILRPQ